MGLKKMLFLSEEMSIECCSLKILQVGDEEVLKLMLILSVLEPMSVFYCLICPGMLAHWGERYSIVCLFITLSCVDLFQVTGDRQVLWKTLVICTVVYSLTSHGVHVMYTVMQFSVNCCFHDKKKVEGWNWKKNYLPCSIALWTFLLPLLQYVLYVCTIETVCK